MFILLTFAIYLLNTRKNRSLEIEINQPLHQNYFEEYTLNYKKNKNSSEKIHEQQHSNNDSQSRKSYVFPTPPPMPSSKAELHIVEGGNNFLERIEKMNEKISTVRQNILKKSEFVEWKDVVAPEKLTVIWGMVDDFFEKLLNVPSFIIVVLPWLPKKLAMNLLYDKYYKWSGTDQLCEWIETPGVTKAHWDAVYNKTCNRDIFLSQYHSQLETMYLHSKPVQTNTYWPNNGTSYPSLFYKQPPPYTLYLTIIKSGIITHVGDVISGSYKIVPYTCSDDKIPTIPNEYRTTKIYREVFVMSQKWGSAYFHRLGEIFPRIAPYILFLKTNPSVVIHAFEGGGLTAKFLSMFDICPDRIVSGIIRAKVVYLPQGSPCGYAQLATTQLLRYNFNQYFEKNLKKKDYETFNNYTKKQTYTASPRPTSRSSKPTRNKLVLIERSGMRKFLKSKEIASAIDKIAKKHNLEFIVFYDNPSPSIITTRIIFKTARVIVAPHGAGLSNMIFSKVVFIQFKS